MNNIIASIKSFFTFRCGCGKRYSEYGWGRYTCQDHDPDFLHASFDPWFNIFQIEARQKGQNRYIEVSKPEDLRKIKRTLDQAIAHNPEWFI